MRAYDLAQDKWKFKQTLTDTELTKIAKDRPESVSFGSISEEEKAKQRQQNTAKLAPGSLTYIPDTKLEAPSGVSLTEPEMRVEQAK